MPPVQSYMVEYAKLKLYGAILLAVLIPTDLALRFCGYGWRGFFDWLNDFILWSGVALFGALVVYRPWKKRREEAIWQ